MKWNVICYNPDIHKFKPYDIFKCLDFLNDTLKNFEKCKNNKSKFIEELETDAIHYFFGQVEYEIVICPWMHTDYNKKIDIYDQLKLNWDVFADYVWNSLNSSEEVTNV